MLEEYKDFNKINKEADEIAKLYNNIDNIRKIYNKRILHRYIVSGIYQKKPKHC